jgi:hypothetical protein
MILNNIPTKMKLFKVLMIFCIIIIMGIECSIAQPLTNIFSEDFTDPIVSSLNWHIPTWVSPDDGTYLGRTQFRCTPAALPAVISGEAFINIDSYNPTGFSFYGTDLISNRSFDRGNGLIITIHAKINSPVPGGIVGGMFLYDLTGTGGTNHDEIDFELVTNDTKKVHTNIYSNEPLGSGHPDSVSIENPFTDYHTYEIKWLPSGVSWLIDGTEVLRSPVSPAGPMHIHLNVWAPDIGWKAAYNSAIQPTGSQSSNETFSMLVDEVIVDSLKAIGDVIISDKESEMIFYPVPAHDRIFFSDSGKLDVRIYNSTGILMLYKKEVSGSLSVSGLSRGLYLIKYEKDEVIQTKKIVIE